MSSLPRIRTLSEAYQAIKESDPNTSMTYHCLRQLVITKQIPSRKIGSRYLINLSDIEDYFTAPTTTIEPDTSAPRGLRLIAQ
jgi:hypothetical protein